MALNINRTKNSKLVIVVGTQLQSKIIDALYPHLFKLKDINKISILSLNNYYKFNVNPNCNLFDLIIARSIINQTSWYESSKIIKFLKLIPFLFSILLIGFKNKYFLFFVDTGILERSAIKILQKIGCKTIVLQDGLKRKPLNKSISSLQCFGSGKADLYLITGTRYRYMISGSSYKIVGSPVYQNKLFTPMEYNKAKRRKRILILNQCFAKYNEISENDEVLFVKEVIQMVSSLGDIELRLHPHNDPVLYDNMQSDNVKISWKNESLGASLKKADLVLAINSTTILEALSLGKIVMTLGWHKSPFEQPVRKGVFHCETRQEFKRIIYKWENGSLVIPWKDSDVQKELLDFIQFSGEESTENILKNLNSFFAR